MKRIIVGLLLALTAPVWAQTPAPVPSEDPATTAAITELREGLLASFNKGDVDQLLTYLDPNIIVTWQNGDVCHGPEEVRAFYARMMKGDKPVVKSLQAKPEISGRQMNGDWGISWGNLHDHFILNDNSDLPFDSHFTATIAKRGDRWLLVAFHASVNVFENPVLSMTKVKTVQFVGLGSITVGVILGFVAFRVFARQDKTA